MQQELFPDRRNNCDSVRNQYCSSLFSSSSLASFNFNKLSHSNSILESIINCVWCIKVIQSFIPYESYDILFHIRVPLQKTPHNIPSYCVRTSQLNDFTSNRISALQISFILIGDCKILGFETLYSIKIWDFLLIVFQASFLIFAEKSHFQIFQ